MATDGAITCEAVRVEPRFILMVGGSSLYFSHTHDKPQRFQDHIAQTDYKMIRHCLWTQGVSGASQSKYNQKMHKYIFAYKV